MVKRLLVLEDGTVFEGTGFGADTYVSGELVLNSAMTGYQELITDQSYKGQILAFTFPVIGTTGINRDDYESIFPGCLAVVVHQLASHPSNWRKQLSLDAYLKKHNIPGIQGVDTRKLAKIVTEHGSMKATVVNEGDAIEHILDQLRATVLPFDQVRQVSTKTPYAAPGFGKSIVLIDLGSVSYTHLDVYKRQVESLVVSRSCDSFLSYLASLLSNSHSQLEECSGATF